MLAPCLILLGGLVGAGAAQTLETGHRQREVAGHDADPGLQVGIRRRLILGSPDMMATIYIISIMMKRSAKEP
jgi:hypothetical protein